MRETTATCLLVIHPPPGDLIRLPGPLTGSGKLTEMASKLPLAGFTM